MKAKMKKNNLKKIAVGIGLLSLCYMPSKSQDIKTKIGVSYLNSNDSKIKRHGIESSAEYMLNKLSFELEQGFYNNSRNYSVIQANLGVKYKPLVKENYNLGIKASLGVTSEFTLKKLHYLNNFLGVNYEKNLKNGKWIDLYLLKDVLNNDWRMGIRYIFKKE